MDQKWRDHKAKAEYGLTWRDKYNIPRPQPTVVDEDAGKASIGMGYQTSQNSVLRSQDVLASFGNSSLNLFIKSKINQKKDGQDYPGLQLDQTRKKQSNTKSSNFLQQLQRKYLPNRKPKHKDALRFLETLISVLRIHIHKQERQVFLLLQQEDKKPINLNRAQFMEYQKQMRKRLNIEKSQPSRSYETNLSDIKPIGQYFQTETQSYVHNATKIDALAEPNLQIEVSEVERPYFKDYDQKAGDLQIQSATKSEFNLSGLSEPKNQAFKFNPKVQKKIMDRKKSEGFNGIIGVQSFDQNMIKKDKKEENQQKVEYKLPNWLKVQVNQQPLSESSPFMQNYEVNKEIYHLNPDTFKGSDNDFHQPIMPQDKDGNTYTNSEFSSIKMTPSTQNCSPDQVVCESQNINQTNLTPRSRQKKYSFVNPYMKNIDSDSNDIGTLNDLVSEEGNYQNFVPEETQKNEEKADEASNSFRISDQNSMESQKYKKRDTYTQKNIPKLNSEYFTDHKEGQKQVIGDRSIQYKINPQDRAYVRPKSNTVGMKNSSSVQVSPKKIQNSNEDQWKKKLQNKIKKNIRNQIDKLQESGRPISSYPNNFGEYLEKRHQPSHKQIKKQSQLRKNSPYERQQISKRQQSKIFVPQQMQQQKFTNFPQPQNFQQFNKPTRTASSGHFTYHNMNQKPVMYSPSAKNIQFVKVEPQKSQFHLKPQIKEVYNQYGSNNRPSYVSPPSRNLPPAYFPEKSNQYQNLINNNGNQFRGPAPQQNSRLPIQYGVSSPRNQQNQFTVRNGPTAQIYFHGIKPTVQREEYRSPPSYHPSNPPSNPPSQLKIGGQQSTFTYAQQGSKTPSRGSKKIHIFSTLNCKE